MKDDYMDQLEFNQTIGTLDQVLSELLGYAKGGMEDFNKQTLKHHAEDMIGAGKSILEKLGPVQTIEHCENVSSFGIRCSFHKGHAGYHGSLNINARGYHEVMAIWV